MKLWAVSYIPFSNNELTTEFHLGATWKEALAKHSAFTSTEDMKDWISSFPNNLEEAKDECFNGDSMIEVVEVGLWHYIEEVISGFAHDPADTDYQRGYLEACKVILADNKMLLQQESTTSAPAAITKM